MHVTIVQVQIKPEHIQDFIEAARPNHAGSVCETGNRRFDVLQRADDPTKFVLYEAYASAEDAAAHKNTPHYLKWRDTVAPWMAAPRVGTPYQGLFPEAQGSASVAIDTTPGMEEVEPCLEHRPRMSEATKG